MTVTFPLKAGASLRVMPHLPSMLVISRFSPEEWTAYRDLRLRALAESPDAFGSTLAQERERPDPEWERRLAAGVSSALDLPLLARLDARHAGLAWCRITPDSQHATRKAALYQVWTAPDCRGHGVGKGMVETSIAWARNNGAQGIALAVTCGETPARRLYERLGFKAVGEPQRMRPDAELMEQSMWLEFGQEAGSGKELP
ncbi:GNAT family N-acetyltransferase [Noviherbaspirillum galbum]|uniref:GNAT family N-acetyltransferase n=1 Tax=Noviherbaspirillum galbum TaxID=2709383 RepID=A0A6B3SPG0_9BURK|nr:GNAT family N-acetyltransferase [Noviherbaspirillum galbum]NEX62398.1 GNAT family N-acetyltransferase [Noviherbaspirillum galbum]